MTDPSVPAISRFQYRLLPKETKTPLRVAKLSVCGCAAEALDLCIGAKRPSPHPYHTLSLQIIIKALRWPWWSFRNTSSTLSGRCASVQGKTLEHEHTRVSEAQLPVLFGGGGGLNTGI